MSPGCMHCSAWAGVTSKHRVQQSCCPNRSAMPLRTWQPLCDWVDSLLLLRLAAGRGIL
jgi:hypothetical protein